jgi:hypothetical protein
MIYNLLVMYTWNLPIMESKITRKTWLITTQELRWLSHGLASTSSFFAPTTSLPGDIKLEVIQMVGHRTGSINHVAYNSKISTTSLMHGSSGLSGTHDLLVKVPQQIYRY